MARPWGWVHTQQKGAPLLSCLLAGAVEGPRRERLHKCTNLRLLESHSGQLLPARKAVRKKGIC
eukprot:8255691-Pyramimonas_sp.AAC.1